MFSAWLMAAGGQRAHAKKLLGSIVNLRSWGQDPDQVG
jgi:hypothetical protein